MSGKLHVSLTKVYDGKNLLVSEFASKQEVIDVSIINTCDSLVLLFICLSSKVVSLTCICIATLVMDSLFRLFLLPHSFLCFLDGFLLDTGEHVL